MHKIIHIFISLTNKWTKTFIKTSKIFPQIIDSDSQLSLLLKIVNYSKKMDPHSSQPSSLPKTTQSPSSLSASPSNLTTPVANTSFSIHSQRDLKKMKDKYEIKIIELQNQVRYCQQQLQYKNDIHRRQMDNLKVFLQYEWNAKIKRQQNQKQIQDNNCIHENNNLQQRIKQLQQEIKIYKQRYERSEKYNKQLQQMFMSIIKKQENLWNQQKCNITENYQKIIDEMKKNKKFNQEEIGKNKKCQQNDKQDMLNKIHLINQMVNEKLTAEIKKNQQLTKKLDDLTSQIKSLQKQQSNTTKQSPQQIPLPKQSLSPKNKQKQPKIKPNTLIPKSKHHHPKNIWNMKSVQLSEPKSLQSTTIFKSQIKKNNQRNKQNHHSNIMSIC